MKTLTIFTPAYNRAHTIGRTYESLCRQTCKDFEWLIIDDGSTDGTRQWVESLGDKAITNGKMFDWMGRPLNGEDENNFVIDLPMFRLTYIYKPNGGLYTGYNVAYATIQTELCVCIDSDDFMPDDAVDKIISLWRKHYPEGEMSKLSVLTSKEYCGIVGNDYNVFDKQPIGGTFVTGVTDAFYCDIKRGGDTKEILRTDLMRQVAPQIGFYGEKDFNPFFMISQVVDKYPILVENSNLCWVEYQTGADSMSQDIYKQFKRSPRSYVIYRINELKLTRNSSWKRNLIACAHYVSACIFSKDVHWLANSPKKGLTVVAVPLGIALNLYIRYKAR